MAGIVLPDGSQAPGQEPPRGEMQWKVAPNGSAAMVKWPFQEMEFSPEDLVATAKVLLDMSLKMMALRAEFSRQAVARMVGQKPPPGPN